MPAGACACDEVKGGDENGSHHSPPPGPATAATAAAAGSPYPLHRRSRHRRAAQQVNITQSSLGIESTDQHRFSGQVASQPHAANATPLAAERNVASYARNEPAHAGRGAAAATAAAAVEVELWCGGGIHALRHGCGEFLVDLMDVRTALGAAAVSLGCLQPISKQL